MILTKSDEWVFDKMQELKDEDALSDYDERYNECLSEISNELGIYFKAIVERTLYKANLYNIDAHTVLDEMVLPELQAKYEELT